MKGKERSRDREKRETQDARRSQRSVLWAVGVEVGRRRRRRRRRRSGSEWREEGGEGKGKCGKPETRDAETRRQYEQKRYIWLRYI
jgi:hypothetical protein